MSDAAAVVILQRLVQEQEPKTSDVIVLLQGDQFDRVEKALELLQAQFASLILLTGNNLLVGTGPRPGENNVTLTAMRQWLLEHKVPPQCIILDDTAMNTREQAMHVINEAVKRRWKRLLLVGSWHHQLRPFLTFLNAAKEQGWSGEIVNQPARLPSWQWVPGGRKQNAREILVEEIVKLDKYIAHVVSVQDGIDHINRFHA